MKPRLCIALAALLFCTLAYAQNCDQAQAKICHALAYCEAAACSCPEGIIGDGVGAEGCDGNAWTVRFSLYLSPAAQITNGNKLVTWSEHVEEFASVLTNGNPNSPSWFMDAMEHTVTIMPETGRKLLTVNALFDSPGAADIARARLQAFLDGSAPVEEPQVCENCCTVESLRPAGVEIFAEGQYHEYGSGGVLHGVAGWLRIIGEVDDAFIPFNALPFPFCVSGVAVQNEFFVSSNSVITWRSGLSAFSVNDASYPEQPALIINHLDTDLREGGAIYGKHFAAGPEGEAYVMRLQGTYYPSSQGGSVIWELVFFPDNTFRVARLADDGESQSTGNQRDGGAWAGLSDGQGQWIVGGPKYPIPLRSAGLFSNAISSPEAEAETMLFGRALSEENVPVDPRMYRWVAPTTAAELQIKPTGMEVESVSFSPSCSNSGCWVVDVIYTIGEDNFNTFFIPNAPGDEQLSYDYNYGTKTDAPWSVWDNSIEDIFLPRNFPCGTNDYDPSALHSKSEGATDYPAPPDTASLCCIPEFLDLYRPVQGFNDFFTGHKHMTVTKEACDAGFVYSLQRPGYDGPVEPIGPYSATAPVMVICTGDRAAQLDALTPPGSYECFDLQEDRGYVAHGNYPNGQIVTWLISAPGQKVTLRMLHLLLERNWDFVKIESCADASCAAGGRTVLMPWASGGWDGAFEVESCTGHMLVTFNSDGSVSGYGFGFEFWKSDETCSTGDGAEQAPVPSADHPDFTCNCRGAAFFNGYSVSGFSPPVAPAVVNPESAYVPMPRDYLDGPFRGMDHSWVEFVSVVDAYIGQYRARFMLDDVELRQKAGKLRGTVGVEYTVDTFVGIANWKPTGIKFLDSFSTRTNLHLEKTSFFSVSTHGTNDYTFLEYVNMRLVTIYNKDDDFSDSSGMNNGGGSTLDFIKTSNTGTANYVQVTFTLGPQYEVNANSDLIPSSSVRAGKGTFLTDAESSGLMTHKCEEYDDGFSAHLAQTCSPNAVMCSSPASIPDQFVSFNIPLGMDYFPTATAALAANIFVHMVVSAIIKPQARTGEDFDNAPNAGGSPLQMKTTLSASIPVVAGGINIFCDGLVSKTDLKDVANADIIVGSASSSAELSRLRIKKDIASTQLAEADEVQIDSDSIEAGLMTLVLHGNVSYFGNSVTNTGNTGVSIELEDVVTIHVMQDDGVGEDVDVITRTGGVQDLLDDSPDDNSVADGLDTNGYALNGAFYFTIDRASQRAHLQPSPALLSICPFNPTRPTGNIALETCITRRDVRYRGYPARTGSYSTAMELCAKVVNNAGDDCSFAYEASSYDSSSCCTQLTTSAESRFFTTIFGNSAYAKQLAVDFANVVADEYQLNGRFRRAYWINPGYEWTPTQTGGSSIFQVSQKLFMFALITLDEGIVASGNDATPPALSLPTVRRRMLLQTVDGLKDAQASGAGHVMTFQTTPTSMMAKAFDVPVDRVATFAVKLQLSEVEACQRGAELQDALRLTLDDYMSGAASSYETVQVTTLAVDKGSVQCAGARRSVRSLLAFSDATADVTMLVVFSKGSDATISLEKLAGMAGVQSIEPVSMSPKIRTADASYVPPPPPSSSSSSSSSTALIAGICGGVGGLLAVGAGVAMCMRNKAAPDVAMAIQTINVNDLKTQLHDEL